MGFTPEQIKGRIKSVAKQNNADARTLMRIYMMERFLERLAQSEYRDNFIIKGGILVTAMIGVAHRSTMDIDTSMKNLNLSAEDAALDICKRSRAKSTDVAGTAVCGPLAGNAGKECGAAALGRCWYRQEFYGGLHCQCPDGTGSGRLHDEFCPNHE